MNENPRQFILKALKASFDVLENADITNISENIDITYPPLNQMGDYATSFPFKLARSLNQPPLTIAHNIAKSVTQHLLPIIDKVEAVSPGYINFSLSHSWLQQQLQKIKSEGNKWGGFTTPMERVLVEYSSPNIAKRMHVGHFRSTLIGFALDNIFRHLGYHVVNDNHLGDWGTQFGKLMVAYRLWYRPSSTEKLTVSELEKLYIRFHKEVKKDETLDAQARTETVKLQQGDPATRKLWKEFCKISLDEFQSIYDLFGISFKYLHGESFYEKMLPSIVKEALDKKVAMLSNGAVIIPLDEVNLPPYMIRKSDGGYLYSTSDLATIKWREENLDLDLVLYIVGDQQKLHFHQLFEAAKKLGLAKKTKLVHIPFGLILGERGRKMSTREGEAVDAKYFINKSIELAIEIIKEKNPSLSPAERTSVAERIALSALVYNDLSRDRESSITFNWGTMMNFKGASAPYLLYTYVRIHGIINKVRTEHPEDFDADTDTSLLNEQYEIQLLRQLIKFPEALDAVAQSYRPHHLVQYLENLANIFHVAYDHLPVAQANQSVRRARLLLFQCVAQTMQIGMKLLGMQPVERM